MSRSIFGWDLPPGCTAQDIENHFGGGEMEEIEEAFWSDKKNCTDELWKKFDDLKLSDDLMNIVNKAIEFGMELGRKEQIEIENDIKATDASYKEWKEREWYSKEMKKEFEEHKRMEQLFHDRRE
jgi:hypothetical protein